MNKTHFGKINKNGKFALKIVSRGNPLKAKPPPKLKAKNPPKLLSKLTEKIMETFQTCNPEFQFNSDKKPKRVLTQKSQKSHPNSPDNIDGNLIIHVGDIFQSGNKKYKVLDLLGAGTFGQVVKCEDIDKPEEFVAIKVIKNSPAFYNQAKVELFILQTINQYSTENDSKNVRFQGYFEHENHLCIIFELLSLNLYELLKMNHFRGLSTKVVRALISQLLDALSLLYDAGIIHCDMKPENILLENLQSTNIKLIDFGSACFLHQTVYSYIQSRFYRSPEVLLRIKYTQAIDMWSLGCIAAELFLGLPLFPGSNEYEQLDRIIHMIGQPQKSFLDQGRLTYKFFHFNGKKYIFKTQKEYSEEYNVEIKESRKYFNYETYQELIMNYPFKRSLTEAEIEEEKNLRKGLIDLLRGLLIYDPNERWTPKEAKQHPFIKGEPFLNAFTPIPNRKRLYFPPPYMSRFRGNDPNQIKNLTQSMGVPPQMMSSLSVNQTQNIPFMMSLPRQRNYLSAISPANNQNTQQITAQSMGAIHQRANSFNFIGQNNININRRNSNEKIQENQINSDNSQLTNYDRDDSQDLSSENTSSWFSSPNQEYYGYLGFSNTDSSLLSNNRSFSTSFLHPPSRQDPSPENNIKHLRSFSGEHQVFFREKARSYSLQDENQYSKKNVNQKDLKKQKKRLKLLRKTRRKRTKDFLKKK